MKKLLKLVLASLMILAGATACSKKTEGTYTPGEYTGEAQGFARFSLSRDYWSSRCV